MWYSAVRLQQCIPIFRKIIEGGWLYGTAKHDYSCGGETEVGMPKRPTLPKKKNDCQGFQAAKESLTLLLQQTDRGQKLKPYFVYHSEKHQALKT